MKKLATTGAALALALTMAISGCGTKAEDTTESQTESVAAEETESKTEETGSSITFTTAKTAEEAAKGAGLDSFGAIDTVTLNDSVFENPTFGYAKGVAQASYETGAMGLYIRKADSTHSNAVTDRNLNEFAAKWTKTYEGTDVTMYGVARGATTVFTWSDGTQNYGVTFQGLGGEEVSMDADEVKQIMAAIMKNNGQSSTTGTGLTSEQSSEQTATAEASGYITAEQAKEAAFSSAGESEANTAWTACELKEGGDAPHYLVSFALGDTTYTYQVDAYTGAVWDIDVYYGSDSAAAGDGPVLSQEEAISIAEKVSGGKANTSYQTKSPEYGYCWYVATTDENGNSFEYFVDDSGSAYLIEED